MVQKEVKVKVATDVDLKKVEALEDHVRKLKAERLQLKIEAETNQLNTVTQKLQEAESELTRLQSMKTVLNLDVDDNLIDKAAAEVQSLREQKINLEIAVESDKLDAAKDKVEELDDTNIDIQLNNQSVMQGIDQISQGFDRLKQGASELKQNMDEVAQAGMQSEQNKAFLELNMDAGKARDTLKDINDIVASMPGDDNTMRSILSTAQALNKGALSADDMRVATGAMADYLSGSAANGKMMAEAENDLKDYLLTGNTACLERDSIYKSQIDKLKDKNTFQERANALDEAATALGYKGLANADTMINKQAEWEGMIYNSQDALSSMWLDAEKGAMDYILKLNDSTNGLVGIGIVASQMVAGPLVSMFTGLGQMATGLKAVKDAADWAGISEKLSPLKTALTDVATGAKNAALGLLDVGKKALTSGYNALKSAGMWAANFAKTLASTVYEAAVSAGKALWQLGINVLTSGYNALKSAAMWIVEKASLVASTIATWAAQAAQWALNIAMSMNPIMLVVIAIGLLIAALAYLYFNNEQVRAAIDGLAATIMGVLSPAIDFIKGLFNDFTSSLGLNTNDWIQGVLGFILFVATLPMQIGMYLLNTLASALGFGNNFVQTMINTAINSVMGFLTYIASLPGRLWNYLSNALARAINFASSLPNTLYNAASNAVSRFTSAIQGIGTALKNCLDWAVNVIMSHPLVQKLAWLGQQAANAFAVIGLGQSSPGKIVKAMRQELEWTEEAVEGSNLSKTTASLGNDLSTSFNPNFETGTVNGILGSTGRAGQVVNINLEIGSVDNEKRIDEIVDAVRKALAWNNKTAGRTV